MRDKNSLSSFKKYFHNSVWLFSEKILRICVGLFVTSWVARYLGPENFGLFNYALSFSGMFAALAGLGLDGILARDLVKTPNKANELLGTAFVLKLAASISALILILMVLFFNSVDHYTKNLIFLISISSIFQSFNVIDIYFQAKVESKFAVYANVILLLISSVVKVYLINSSAPLIYFCIAVVFDSFVLAIGLIYFYLKNKNEITKWKFDFVLAKNFLMTCWPLIIGMASASIYMRIDQLIIKQFLGNSAVGYYAAAVRLVEVWMFASTVITQSFSTAITNAKKVNHELFIERVQMQYNLLVKISFVISLGTCIFAEPIVNILYGNSFEETVGLLRCYSFSLIFVYLSNASWSYYFNENLQFLGGLRLAYGAVINAGLNLLLIPYYGVYGSVIATLFSYSFSSFFVNYFSNRTRANFHMQSKALLSVFDLNSWHSTAIFFWKNK
jgi:O-antigen/teichoic acid export membrane protein